MNSSTRITDVNAVDHLHRSADGCLCCGSEQLKREVTVISPFLAKRCWNGKPELTWVMFCGGCGFRFYDRGLSEEEATAYYSTYRDATYLKQRHRFEPFYTRREHARLEVWLASKERRIALRECLDKAGAPEAFEAALDYGGGTGKMLADIAAKEKAVFDVIEEDPEPGVTAIESPLELGNRWDLVLSCQVLEHLTDPLRSLLIIRDAMPEGGWLYAEVPPQIWSNPARDNQTRTTFLRWLIQKPRLLLAADVISTALRVKRGFLPPLGFVPMREHLNYFTDEALSQLVSRAGFTVRWAGRNSLDCICAVGTRSAAVGEKEVAA